MSWRADGTRCAAIGEEEAPEGVLVVSAWSPKPPRGRFRARVSVVSKLDATRRRTVEVGEPEQVVALVSEWLSTLGRDEGAESDRGLSAD